MLLLTIQVAIFALSTWLGLYLIARRSPHDALVFAGLGLLLIAGGAAIEAFKDRGDTAGLDGLAGFTWGTGLGLVAFALYLAKPLAPQSPWRWRAGLGVAFALAIALAVFTDLLTSVTSSGVRTLALAGLFTFVAMIGFWLARLDAARRREQLLPDLLRSFDYAFLIALLFGGQVILAMAAGPGVTTIMLALLLAVLATSIATQVFLDQVQGLLDRVAFANVPWLRAVRSDLREAASDLPRRANVLELSDDEFVRVTRRALSDFGDLTKLAASPLTELQLIDERLRARQATPTSLERASELKTLLTEAIAALKPPGSERFGVSDEWRYYNALYFPYVVGMRPFSRRATHEYDDPVLMEALEWFRIYVPERTLHNWQNAAARLIAQHLLERSQVESEARRLVG